jgi:outer membrane protein
MGQQTAAPAAPKSLVKGKIAVINTQVLQEQIGEYKAKIDGLNRQFEPRVREVQSLVDKINALETTIKSQSGVLTPAKLAEMNEQLEQMKRDQKRKAEDLQSDGERAQVQTLAPIKEKLQKFLQDFTAKRGITVLWDLGNAVEANAMVWYDSRADVTQDFIKEYNRANPVSKP